MYKYRLKFLDNINRFRQFTTAILHRADQARCVLSSEGLSDAAQRQIRLVCRAWRCENPGAIATLWKQRHNDGGHLLSSRSLTLVRSGNTHVTGPELGLCRPTSATLDGIEPTQGWQIMLKIDDMYFVEEDVMWGAAFT